LNRNISVAEYKKLKPARKKIVHVLQSCPVKDLAVEKFRDVPGEALL